MCNNLNKLFVAVGGRVKRDLDLRSLHMRMSLICKTMHVQGNIISFPEERLCNKTRFETETSAARILSRF